MSNIRTKYLKNITITTGVPQGSILGPLLFIIYINDISKITKKFHFTIYADDTTLIEPICTFAQPTAGNIDLLTREINLELEAVVQWLALNKLSLNAKKTKMMLFHFKQKSITNTIPKLKINNVDIERVKDFNFLGLTIDEHMTWKAHAQKVACKMSCIIGTMKRLKKSLPTGIMKILYNSLILPHISYGIILWGKQLKRVNKLQKWALRTVTNSKYNAHTEPILKKLNLLKAQDIYKITAIKFYYKYKNDQLPEYFHNFFENFLPSHGYNTRDRTRKRLSPSTVTASQSPKYSIPNIIDSIDETISAKIMTHSIQNVAKTAKKLFISTYSETCSIANCNTCNYKPNTD